MSCCLLFLIFGEIMNAGVMYVWVCGFKAPVAKTSALFVLILSHNLAVGKQHVVID